MNSSSRIPAVARDRQASFWQLRWLLLSLLAFGLFLSLPSPVAANHYGIESDRADRVLASDPFIVAGNDLARAVRSGFNAQIDDDSADPPAVPGPAGAIVPPALSASSLVEALVFSPRSLPVSSLPGAPRAPPVSPL